MLDFQQLVQITQNSAFINFKVFLFLVVIVTSVYLKLHFTRFNPQPITSENFFSDRTRKKPLLRRLKNIGLASEKLYRNALKPTYLRNRSILRIFQPGYRLVRMNLHTLLQRYRSELYQGILHLLHKLGFLEKWCIGLHHWTDKSCTGLDQPLLRQKFKS